MDSQGREGIIFAIGWNSLRNHRYKKKHSEYYYGNNPLRTEGL